MVYEMPVKVYQERNAVANHAGELAALGRKACIVTGRHSSRQNGSLEDVLSALKAEGREWEVFDGIEENPSVETVVKAAQAGIRAQADFVIGIGGGSPLDAAKAVALLMASRQEWEADGLEAALCYLYAKKPCPCLPVAAVPTTAGTGSEVTPYAVLTLHREHTKRSISHRIFPEIALVDERYLEGMDRDILVNTAVDALAHLIESYLNTNAASYADMFCERGLYLFGQAKEGLAAQVPPPGQYGRELAVSTLAGMAISHTGTSLPHGMSYSLTYEKGVPHGRAVGFFQKAYIDAYEGAARKERLLELMGFADVEALGAYIEGLTGRIAISREELERYTKKMMGDARKLANFPYPMTEEKMRGMFEKSLEIR